MIDELKENGWTFTYIGANHDVEKIAMSISITNTMKFDASVHGTTRMFAKERNSRMSYLDKLSKNEDVRNDYFTDEDNKDADKS